MVDGSRELLKRRPVAVCVALPVIAFIVAFVVMFLIGSIVHAAEGPHAPRLAADGGVVAGGFRISSGEEGSFSLFSAKANGDDLRSLGQFYGRLAGVALDDGGAVLALTADGALGRYGDDVEPLAVPDSRWNMAGLYWADGAPLAFSNDNGLLHAVRPGANGEWTRDETPLAEIGERARVDGLLLPDGLHLLIVSFAEDLSRGAARHLVRADSAWRELPSLPIGDVAAFAAVPAALPDELFSDETAGPSVAPGIVALRRDPVFPERTTLSFHAWRGSAWTRLPLPEGFEDTLRETRFFTAAAGAEEADAAWLLTGAGGAFFTPAGESPDSVAVRVGAAAPREDGWSRWSSPVTLVAFAALVVVYCRRSRALSRAMPGRPPDLFSRGAALAADWLIVSFLMTGWHVANGDVNILHRLLNLEDIETIFWANLAGLVLFTGLFEILGGKTPGKHLAGLHVRSVFGGRASFPQLLLRNLLRIVDMFPLAVGFPGLIGAVATLLGKRRQRVGDMIARTVVLRHHPLAKRDFLLASASPRRLELLGALGLGVRTEAMDVNEDIPSGEAPADAVCRLSMAKARAAGSRARPGEVIIAADTIVVLDDKVLGKPASAAEAKFMLSSLSGRSHRVYTGVTVWDTATGQGVTEYEETEVEFRILSDREMDNYVASGEPMDKAGGYGVQSGFFIKQVRGSMSNVVGLPMEKLRIMLAALDS